MECIADVAMEWRTEVPLGRLRGILPRIDSDLAYSRARAVLLWVLVAESDV
jgi:hypothetical protein